MTNENKSEIKTLEKFIGTWQITGPNISGQVRFEWLEGGYFLVQHVDIIYDSRKVKGVEYIGYDKDSKQFKSHLFDNAGNHFTYVWELNDKNITIWFGEKDSPNLFKGKFDHQYESYSGAWEWHGGGYSATAKKIELNL